MKVSIKETTLSTYTNIIENHIKDTIGNICIASLTSQHITAFTERLLTSGRKDRKGGLNEKTVCDILFLLREVINYYNIENPNQKVYVNITYPKYREKEIQILSKDEKKRLLTYCMIGTDTYKLGIIIALFTGVRIGELCAVRWQDIDIEERIMYIRHTVQRIRNTDPNDEAKTKLIIGTPKSKTSRRVIPLSDVMVALLIKHIQRNKSKYVLSGSLMPEEPRVYQYKFKRYLKESNVRDINFHSLRHTFASDCIESGFDIKGLSEILGHSNVNTTLNKYVHLSLDFKRANMNKLNQTI